MARLRRGQKLRRDRTKPEIVTGNFELHYEDVVARNRFALVLVIAGGLILFSVFVPGSFYNSLAESDLIRLEAERGTISNDSTIKIIGGDITASDNAYLEFSGVE